MFHSLLLLTFALLGFRSAIALVFSARLLLLSLVCLLLFISDISYYRNAPAVSLWNSPFPPLTLLPMSSSPMTLNTICTWKIAHLSTSSPRPSTKFQALISSHVSDIPTSISTPHFKIDRSKTKAILPHTTSRIFIDHKSIFSIIQGISLGISLSSSFVLLAHIQSIRKLWHSVIKKRLEIPHTSHYFSKTSLVQTTIVTCPHY